ncbi:peptidoglycan-binding protein [Ancylobacter sp. IITR112]|uniref:peptidoglycan-binding domain-containing protein n=1 Tax=Ancylobacter sp. IITR112 TaxID=3138073 RepID=UPI00352AEB5C
MAAGIAIGIGVGAITGAIIREQQRQPRYPAPAPKSRATAPRAPSAEEIAARQAESERIAMEQARVKDIQARLNMLNFDAGTPDGKAGERTRGAVRAFQASIGVPATGDLSADQYAMLRSSTSGQPQSPSVAEAQPALTPLREQPSEAIPPLVVAPNAGPPATTPRPALPDVAIFGVKPLDRPDDIKAKLADAGLSVCREKRSSIVCSNHTDALSDIVTVGLSDATEQRAYVVLRETRFKEPRPRAQVEERLRGSYAALLDRDGSTLSSGELCSQQFQALQGNDGLEAFRAAVVDGRNMTQVSALGMACDYYYAVNLPAGENIGSLSIGLFAGAPLRTGPNDGVAAGMAAAGDDLRF